MVHLGHGYIYFEVEILKLRIETCFFVRRTKINWHPNVKSLVKANQSIV